MFKATRICSICGIEYPYCRTATSDKFRWQDVACCPEHGVQYFCEVAASRGEAKPNLVIGVNQKVIEVKEETPIKTVNKKVKDRAKETEE